jgi:RNA polymerase sigma factor (sigma-70 family)
LSQLSGSHGDSIQDRLAGNLHYHYGAFVRANEEQMLRYAKSLGVNEFDAEECVQEAFIRVYKQLRTLTPPEIRAMNLVAYLKKVVHNCVIDLLRRNGRGNPKRELPLTTSFTPTDDGIPYDQVDEQTEGPELAYINHELRGEVLALLNELPNKKYQRIIQARFFGDMSLAEMANMFGMTTVGISRILKQCLNKLRALPKAQQIKETR